ncbi:Uncharacterised protein [Enterobacter hormaechei]|jgi:hypothetical protein|nr:hypothetical protein L463_04575 [Enterobacter sp. BIDMC 27]EUM27463.1 hypothetical protein L407_04335 [Enterobacter sp. BWH 39]CZW19222.1 Uncharacterised protein [Enterobacter hormaechei]SAG81618.1 Uncharacterised protein [Enterobacter hormaechei]VAG70405.1 Uncharacterised protein [Enterobacter hormaechei]
MICALPLSKGITFLQNCFSGKVILSSGHKKAAQKDGYKLLCFTSWYWLSTLTETLD